MNAVVIGLLTCYETARTQAGNTIPRSMEDLSLGDNRIGHASVANWRLKRGPATFYMPGTSGKKNTQVVKKATMLTRNMGAFNGHWNNDTWN